MSNSKEKLDYTSDLITKVTEYAKEQGVEKETADMMIACASFLDNFTPNEAELPWNIPDDSDDVNHPSHYNVHAMECIDEIIIVLGLKGAMYYCLGCYLKYRYRAGSKGTYDDGLKDMQKSDWYIAKAMELQHLLALSDGGNE